MQLAHNQIKIAQKTLTGLCFGHGHVGIRLGCQPLGSFLGRCFSKVDLRVVAAGALARMIAVVAEAGL